MKYTVVSGDTMESISIKILGSSEYVAALWTINKANLKSSSPSALTAGETLEIPDQLISQVETLARTRIDDVFLHVGGKAYGGWESIRIARSIESASGSFDVSLSDKWEPDADPWPIFPGDPVRVTIGNDLVVTGWVDSSEISEDAQSNSFSIRGRDKTCDLIDCSVVNRPGEFRLKTPEQIAAALCATYGVKVSADVDTYGVIDLFRCDPGETVFEALERLARSRELLVCGQPDGSILLTRSGTQKIETALSQGQNIQSISLSVDFTDRFSKYVVEGQASGQGAVKQTIRQTGSDAAVKRYRVLNIQADGEATSEIALRRAKWEARTRAAKSQTVTVVVPGWRIKPGGDLWQVGKLVSLDYERFRIDEKNLLVTDIEFAKDDMSGTITTLTLKRADLYQAQSELEETGEILQAHKEATAAQKAKIRAQKKAAKKKKKASSKVSQADINKELKTLDTSGL